MASQQDTLIYIEENERNEARIFSCCFADKNIRNRAYVNVLGAELAIKYLNAEGIAIQPSDNLHNIRKILEEFDIADVILPHTHIDVRVIFDEKYIFIPKSHFEFNITPHIYLVFELAKDISHVKFHGFFESQAINREKQNEEYYFFDKKNLISPDKLKDYLENAQTSTKTELSDEEYNNFNESIIGMVDNDIDELEKKILMKVLTKSPKLRNKFIEFENFELISYRAANELTLREVAEENENQHITDADSGDEFEIFEKYDIIDENLLQTDDVFTSDIYDDNSGKDFIDNPEENKED